MIVRLMRLLRSVASVLVVVERTFTKLGGLRRIDVVLLRREGKTYRVHRCSFQYQGYIRLVVVDVGESKGVY